MIDVHDLCVGNLVYDGDKTQFPMFIRAIGEDYVLLDFEGNEGDLWESTPEDLQGIPLISDILEKAGFSFDNGYWKLRFDEHIYLEYYPYEHRLRRWYVGIDEWDNHAKVKEVSFECRCYNLHELQNSFYMATRQQLNIKI